MVVVTGNKPGGERVRRAIEPLLRSLRTGIYAYLILNLIESEGSVHGYRIMKVLSEHSGVIKPAESTVYETLKKLEKMKLVEAEWVLVGGKGPPRKLYRLTELGVAALEVLRGEVKELIRLLEGVGGGG